ncbi:conserved hypothetical protein [Xenorhabdus bovienii str. oregonense]|uniref:Uncharacterized protein n=1 Tax=Xenorhabdus bovienii str. oregonense TaxID=1398202 RepID=A0A077P6J8_XENBV|nr:hypothetical protein [Xenorhabdus bovienii]CDH05431.1 conserved hypothetical protein [Xenorhabdus bovienii str. oregonense]
MAKPWRDVVASSQYQSLNPQQQAAAQEQYFNEVVVPKAGDKVEAARQQFYAAYPLPQQQQAGNPIAEAGKGFLQAGVNVANIIPSIGDAVVSAGAWAGEKAGLGDGTYTPASRFELPDNLKPQDTYAKIGSEVAPYLIPGIGAEKTAAALGSVVNAGKLERGATKLADMVAENTIGALAQNSSKDNAGGLATDLGIGTAASGVARVVTPVLGKALNVVGEKTGLNKLFRGAEEGAGAGGAGQGAPQPPPQKQLTPEETLRQMAAQKNPDLASSLQGLDVKVQPDVKAAADRLGVTEDLLPSHLSGNQQYQAVEQAIKSRAGSALKQQEDTAILKLSESAGKLIDDVAKAPDALSLNQKIIGQVDSRMAALEHRSDQLYKQVDNAMLPATRVEANNTALALERKADELGGWDNLDTIEKTVFKAVNPSQDGILTYANLNKQRRLVGQALFKNRGPYKDADEGALRYLYSQLSKDQRAVLGDVGAGRDFEVAQRLVQMRKGLEDQMVQLRGKNLTGDIANRSTLAVASLARGNSKQFSELMKNIPSRQMRQEVAGTAIRDMLSAGKRGADFNPAGFADWYQNLRTSGNLRILAQYMPREFMSGLHDTYVVANAIRRAKSFEITTGRLNDFTKRFDAVTAPHELMAKYAGRVGTMAGTKLGPLGAVAGGALGEKLAVRARMAGGAGSSEAAEKLILSSEFQQATKGIEVPPARGKSKYRKAFDEAKLRTSKQWREFYDSLPDIDKRTIARIGIIGWANQNEEEQ